VIGTDDGFWYSVRERRDKKFDFAFYRHDVCVSKGWAGSRETCMTLFKEMVQQHRTQNPSEAIPRGDPQ
jgi:hypothetical protein